MLNAARRASDLLAPPHRPSTATSLPTGEVKTLAVESMFDRISGRYDLVNRLMTFGLDIPWRRRSVRALALPPGSVVVDLACGTGDFCEILARSGHRVIGIDRSAGMLEVASARLRDHPLTRYGYQPVLLRSDGTELPLRTASADGLTCGFALRNFTDLPSVIDEMARVLRPGGRLALLEVSVPSSPIARLGNAIWFNRCVPLLGRLLSDPDAYSYLPRSVEYLPDPPGLAQMLTEAGFATVCRRTLLAGSAQLVTATRVGMPPGPSGSQA